MPGDSYLSHIQNITSDNLLWGGKASSVFILHKNGFNIPDSFVLSSHAIHDTLHENGIELDYSSLVETYNSDPLLAKGRCDSIQEQIDQLSLDRLFDLSDEHRERLILFLSPGVAVRSSGAYEDGSEASFAGCFDSFFGANSMQTLTDQIKQCWKSAASFDVVNYLAGKKLSVSSHFAVLIQQCIQCEVSGVCFSHDPVFSDKACSVIECNWGVGLSVVSGNVQPDRYSVSKLDLSYESVVGAKKRYAIFDAEGVVYKDTPSDIQNIQCLTSAEVMEIHTLATKLEALYHGPVDIEWGYRNGELFIFQVRPMTMGL